MTRYYAYCEDCSFSAGPAVSRYWALEKADRHTDVFHDHVVVVDEEAPQRWDLE